MFYDLDDPEMMYELDRRHRHWLKENGVIRQGVLWRKEELLEWFDKRAAEGDKEAAEMKGVMIAWYDNATRWGRECAHEKSSSECTVLLQVPARHTINSFLGWQAHVSIDPSRKKGFRKTSVIAAFLKKTGFSPPPKAYSLSRRRCRPHEQVNSPCCHRCVP